MAVSSTTTIEELRAHAAVLRRHIIEAGAQHLCHVGGALSAADILAALYFRVMKVDPSNPAWRDRDYFILSKGHAVLALDASLAERGFFPVAELEAFERKGGILAGHPTLKVPGVEVATGSLGHGLAIGIGIALACRTEGALNRVFVMLGDGELQEGTVWEAALSAPRLQLDNLTAIVDNNGFQAMGAVETIMPVQPLAEKWRAFGWNTLEIDGNDMVQVVEALERQPESGKPTALIARTVKGKGAPCLENSPRAHYTRLTEEEAAEALRGLEVAS